MRHLQLRPTGAARRHGGFGVEEGGFGKGAALDAALHAVSSAGATRALLDLGGQVAVVGGQGSPFEVALAHPREREDAIATLRVVAGSVATSGNGQRRREGRGPHLLDPRTGRPARDFGSLTVWAASALVADALSTGLYVMGPEGALAWATRHPEYGVIVVELAGTRPRVRLSGALAQGRLPIQVEAVSLSKSSAPKGGG